MSGSCDPERRGRGRTRVVRLGVARGVVVGEAGRVRPIGPLVEALNRVARDRQRNRVRRRVHRPRVRARQAGALVDQRAATAVHARRSVVRDRQGAVRVLRARARVRQVALAWSRFVSGSDRGSLSPVVAPVDALEVAVLLDVDRQEPPPALAAARRARERATRDQEPRRGPRELELVATNDPLAAQASRVNERPAIQRLRRIRTRGQHPPRHDHRDQRAVPPGRPADTRIRAQVASSTARRGCSGALGAPVRHPVADAHADVGDPTPVPGQRRRAQRQRQRQRQPPMLPDQERVRAARAQIAARPGRSRKHGEQRRKYSSEHPAPSIPRQNHKTTQPPL